MTGHPGGHPGGPGMAGPGQPLLPPPPPHQQPQQGGHRPPPLTLPQPHTGLPQQPSPTDMTAFNKLLGMMKQAGTLDQAQKAMVSHLF